MKNTVYLVRNEGEEIQRRLEEAGCEVLVGDGKFQDDYLAVCDALVLGKERLTREVLKKAPKLKFVGKFGVGVDRIDIDACTESGIYVANTPMTNYISVAEHTIALIMASAKKLYPISLYLRHEYPDYWCRDRYEGVELYEKKLAIIGLGNIGRRVAQLGSAFGMEIIGYDPYADAAKLPEYITLTSKLDEALSTGDFVSLHVVGNEETRNMIGARELSLMKPEAILINVSRGFVVDEDALIQALREKRIAGAALDVFRDEPIQPANPLMLMENVVATPHCAANTKDARLRSQIECAENILAVLRGGYPKYALNQPVK